MAAVDVVHAQVDAFNARDLDGFVATYAPDAVVVGVAPEPLVGSHIREFYASRLADPTLSCVLDTVIAFGERWVVARERISSQAGNSETIATFDVVDGAIRRASILKA